MQLVLLDKLVEFDTILHITLIERLEYIDICIRAVDLHTS